MRSVRQSRFSDLISTHPCGPNETWIRVRRPPAPDARGCSSLHSGAGNHWGGSAQSGGQALERGATVDVLIDENRRHCRVSIDYTGRCPLILVCSGRSHAPRRSSPAISHSDQGTRAHGPGRRYHSVHCHAYDPKSISENGFAVCERDQSRWSSQRSCTQLTGRAPACMTRSIAAWCASTEVPPTASTTG